MKVARQWHRMHREMVDAPILETLKVRAWGCEP